jgi:hypothetical protein
MALAHPDLNLRSDVCGLICESKKGAAEPTQAEVELLKAFIIVNSSVQSSEFRQKM